ncbi:MAG: SusC/RagA family TonB-linked outer membrane protein [Bacteroidales bacterium]
MRYFIFLKCCAVVLLCLAISASGAYVGDGQNAYAQSSYKSELDISLDKVSTLGDLFDEIERVSNFRLVYSSKDVDTGLKVGKISSSKSLDDVLGDALKPLGFSYKISGNYVSVTKNASQQEKKSVSGVVTDSNGEPITGATVMVKGTTRATITDVDGKYSFIVPEDATLVFSFMGMKEVEMLVGNQSSVNVSMVEDAKGLDEVVVTALGIKREAKVLAYDVQEVGGEDVTRVKDPNFVTSLNGKIAGVTINSAGGPGSPTKVVMRGSKSISQGNNALYVIDGIPISNSGSTIGTGRFSGISGSDPMANINPDDIESISVLTGPSAAALYGFQAANGAIVITTKKGEEGKAKFTFSSTTEFSSPFVTHKFQNKYGNDPGDFRSWGEELETPSSYDPNDYFQTGFNLMNNLSVSMGTKQNQTYFSLGATNSEGVVPSNEYNRYNVKVRNTSTLLNDRMDLDLSFDYISQDDKNRILQGQYFNQLIPVYLFPVGEDFDRIRLYERYNPTTKLMEQYWPWGDNNLAMQNPFWIANKNLLINKMERIILNGSVGYQFTDWFKLTYRVRYDKSFNKRERKAYASTISILAGPNGRYQVDKSEKQQFYSDLIGTFSKKFGDIGVNGVLGASVNDSRSTNLMIRGDLKEIPNHFTLNNLIRTGEFRINEGGYGHTQTRSIFLSGDVGYKNYAFLTLTGRNDWASQLSDTDNESFFYGSVGGSVLLSEIIKMPNFMDFAKIRASYSQVGNPPPAFLVDEQYPYDNGNLTTTTVFPFPELEPERTSSYELGIDLKMFKGSLNISTSLYKSMTENQLFRSEASSSSGYSSFYVQAGAIENKGIEASLSYNLPFKGDFKWNTALTYSLNRNEVKELLNNAVNPITGEVFSIDRLIISNAGTYRQILTEGGTVGDMYTTTALLRDANDYVFMAPDITVVEETNYAGTVLPKYNMGFSNSLSYKDFTLDFLITLRVGGNIISATQAYMDYYGVSEASADARDNGGVFINEGLYNAEKYYTITGGDAMYSNYVYSATNARLQELSLGYKLPGRWFNDKLNIKASVVAKNLFMIYNSAPIDPEVISSTGNSYQGIDYFTVPSTRTIGFNLNVNF